MSKKKRTPEEVAEYLNLFEKSGLSRAAFAKQHQLNPVTLYKWHRKHKAKPFLEKASKPQMIPVRVVQKCDEVIRSPAVRLYLRGGHYFEFASETSPQFFGKLIGELS